MSDKFQEKVNENELTDVVELIGESGDVFKFYHIGTIEYKGDWFAFFQPSEPMDGIDPASIVIFQITDENGKEVLLPIKDEKLLDEVYDEYMKELEDEDDGCTGNCEGCHGCDGKD